MNPRRRVGSQTSDSSRGGSALGHPSGDITSCMLIQVSLIACILLRLPSLSWPNLALRLSCFLVSSTYRHHEDLDLASKHARMRLKPKIWFLPLLVGPGHAKAFSKPRPGPSGLFSRVGRRRLIIRQTLPSRLRGKSLALCERITICYVTRSPPAHFLSIFGTRSLLQERGELVSSTTNALDCHSFPLRIVVTKAVGGRV